VESQERTTRGEIIFVIVLFAMTAVMIAGAVLHEKGLWPSPAVMLPIYRVLWGILWLPGLVLLGLLFHRIRKLSLLLGLLLQLAAVALFALRLDQLRLAAAMGMGGLVLPLVWAGIATPEPLSTRVFTLSVLLAMPLFAVGLTPPWDHIQAWNLALLATLLVAVLIPYAVMLWPALQTVMDEDARRQREWWIRHPWLNRGLKLAAILLGVATLIVAGQGAWLYWSLR